jgi:hypothetical protein
VSVLVYGESMINVPVAILAFQFFYQMEHLDALSVNPSLIKVGLDPASLANPLDGEPGPFFSMVIKAAKAIGCGIAVAACSSVIFRVVGSHAPPLTVLTKLSEKQRARALAAGSSGTGQFVDARKLVCVGDIPDHVAASAGKLSLLCRAHGGGALTALTLRKKKASDGDGLSWAMICFDEFESALSLTQAKVSVPGASRRILNLVGVLP